MSASSASSGPSGPHQPATDPPATRHLRDVVYGAIDGSVTTFAIVAGVAGAGLSPYVIVALGLANVLADGFSMAAGNYSGTKAELDDLRRLRQIEARRITHDPESAHAALRDILATKGLSGATLEAATRQIATHESRWTDMLVEGCHGIGPVDPRPLRAALATFVAFLAAGMLPLLPFLLGIPGAFWISAFVTLATFFAIGSMKAHWSLTAWWRSGAETLAIGGAAAALAYVVGTAFG